MCGELLTRGLPGVEVLADYKQDGCPAESPGLEDGPGQPRIGSRFESSLRKLWNLCTSVFSVVKPENSSTYVHKTDGRIKWIKTSRALRTLLGT